RQGSSGQRPRHESHGRGPDRQPQRQDRNLNVRPSVVAKPQQQASQESSVVGLVKKMFKALFGNKEG
ncbi:MAG: hypothetical protein EBU49_10940, partial [Proteobacteria bacterium]|nr:hypothetical protein [Pseudomonadota bacterium]